MLACSVKICAMRAPPHALQPLPATQSAARARLAEETWDRKALLFEKFLRRSE